ncbi:2-dehydropantoate 2-reductase [Candidatus Woesearchaeota archaeon]|nr:2-dehydropantoate 2-reductase [Candidatus Woesearchaeota archaeon]
MAIIILGAGAVGSVFGAKLSQHNDVLLVARKEHADRINRDGLKTKGIENSNYRIKALTNINEIKKNTLILLATKVHDSKNAIEPIKNLVKKDTVILCVQNGLGSEGIVKKIIKDRCLVLRAVTNIGAVYLKPGIVEFNGHSYTAIEKSAESGKIAENLSRCGLKSYVSDDIKAEVWKKLVLNCVINPLTAILGVRNNGIAGRKYDGLKSMIIDECLEVAEKEGIRFEMNFLKTMNEAIKNSNNISSMQQDLLKGRKTEINFLNGAIVKLGRKRGIKTPVNWYITGIIKEMEGITMN